MSATSTRPCSAPAPLTESALIRRLPRGCLAAGPAPLQARAMPRKRPATAPRSREAPLRAVGAAPDEVRARCDRDDRRRNDPVEFVHRYADPHDQELVALVASAL